jgi:hypothetical protein
MVTTLRSVAQWCCTSPLSRSAISTAKLNHTHTHTHTQPTSTLHSQLCTAYSNAEATGHTAACLSNNSDKLGFGKQGVLQGDISNLAFALTSGAPRDQQCRHRLQRLIVMINQLTRLLWYAPPTAARTCPINSTSSTNCCSC